MCIRAGSQVLPLRLLLTKACIVTFCLVNHIGFNQRAVPPIKGLEPEQPNRKKEKRQVLAPPRNWATFTR